MKTMITIMVMATALSACTGALDSADGLKVDASRQIISQPTATGRNAVAVDPPSTDLPTDLLTDNQDRLARKVRFGDAPTLAPIAATAQEGSPEEVGLDPGFTLTGVRSQAGMLFGMSVPGARVRLDDSNIMVDGVGRFVLGFGRDSALTARLVVTLPDGRIVRHTIELADKAFPEQRINGLDQSKVSGFTEAQLVKIRADQALFKAARATTQAGADWVDGFDWPLTGRISGVFGARRILNGEPKRPHSGVDVARLTGTPIIAPAAGVVTLAEPDMYFGGGTILLDHGHWVESAFLHMSRLDVAVGERVEKGQIIGAVGATGRVTGPHLHWSVRWLALNRLVDPQLLAGDMPVTQ